MNRFFSGTYLFELVINGNSDKILMPTPLDLYGKRIKSVEFVDNMNLTPNGGNVFTGDAQLTLTELYTKTHKVADLNLAEIATSRNKGDTLFINKCIDFGQSYVFVPNSQSYIGQTILLLFYYDEPSQMGFVPQDGQNKTTFDSFELPILNTNKSKWIFPENNNLRGKKYQQLLLQLDCDTPQGNKAIDDNVAKTAYITLKKDNYEFIRKFPLYRLYQTELAWGLRFQNVIFDMTNSYVEFADLSLITAGQDSVFINCINDDND